MPRGDFWPDWRTRLATGYSVTLREMTSGDNIRRSVPTYGSKRGRSAVV